MLKSAAGVAFALAAASPAWAVDNPAAMGLRLVEKNCARCHAVGAAGASPHTEAPPFRDLHNRYPPEALGEALAEGISTGHPDMPEFVLTPAQVAAIIAYIGSLNP